MTKYFFVALLTLCVTFSLVSGTTASKKKVEMDDVVWMQHLRNMGIVRDYIEQSNLPHQDVIRMEKYMDDFMGEIYRQIREQSKPDTAKKK